ncbi:MAG: hypothetical protein AAFQ50_00045 [Pseudomonadota bacterium]
MTLTDGTDVTPIRRKERGLLALLALSPGQRKPRNILKDKLWSDRSSVQASNSLRRALCDLRRFLGPAGAAVKSDRHDIWLTAAFEIDRGGGQDAGADLLEGLDVPDAEFEEWLRDLRQNDSGNVVMPQRRASNLRMTPRISDASTLVTIMPAAAPVGPEDTFLSALLMDTFSSRMKAEGDAEVHVGSEPTNQRISEAGAYLRLEVASVVNDGRWHVHLRAFMDRGRRFLWSGRFDLPLDFRVICDGTDLAAFVSTALANIFSSLRNLRTTSRSTYLTLHRTAHRLFTARRDDVAVAETELAALSSSSSAALALAWRAFALLTRALEFGEDQNLLRDQAKCLIGEALILGQENPLVLALAAQVEIKLCNDLERGKHLATASLRACDQNPYALHAMSQAQLYEGAFGAAHDTALRARRMAEGMSNAFCWDMQVCLTALGIEDLATSEAAARSAHACNPDFRPALRYLTALNLIQSNRDRAVTYAAALAEREPGFVLSDLKCPSYPMHTLRRAGFDRDLMDA